MGGGGLSVPMNSSTSQIYATEMPPISLARNATLVTALNFRPICQSKLSHRAHIHKRKVKTHTHTHTHKKKKARQSKVYFLKAIQGHIPSQLEKGMHQCENISNVKFYVYHFIFDEKRFTHYFEGNSAWFTDRSVCRREI